jgi:hypothetical protein
MNFTYQNHLRYYLDERLYGDRQECWEKYRVEVGSIDHDHYRTSSYQNEQKRTADLIYQDFGSDFVVMFSGGTDSEIVIRSFLSIGVQPRCVFIRFNNDYNLEDYLIAEQITTNLGLKLEVFDFDVIDFYRSGHAAEFAAELQCRQIAYLTVYHAIRKLGLPAVMGGEMLLRRTIPSNRESEWYYTFRENEDASAMRFSLKYNIPLVNEWFSYTPEMMVYYLEHPGIQWLVSTKGNYKLGSVSTKNQILHSLLPGLTKKKKTHGYENLGAFNIETYFELYQTHIPRLESSLDGIKLTELVKQLGVEYNANIKTGYDSQSTNMEFVQSQ